MTLYTIPSTFDIVRRNECLNPRLGVDTAGWSYRGTWPSTGYAAVLGPDGEAVKAILADAAVTSSGLGVRYSKVLAAGTHRIGFWARTAWVSGTVNMRVATGTGMLGSETLAGIPAVQGWHWYGFRVVIPTEQTIYIGARFEEGATMADIAMTKMFIRRTNTGGADVTADEYFDGSFASTAAVNYSWEGLPDASTSIESIPNALSRIDTLATLMPYTATRRSRTVVHTLLDEPIQLFTFRQATLPEGVFEVLIESHTAAYAALNKLSARTAWALYDEADDGPIERWFMIAEGDIEMRQSNEVAGAYVLRVPYVEVDSI